MGRTLQRDLNRIAEIADTSTSEGLNYVLTGEVYKHVIFHSDIYYLLFIFHSLMFFHIRFTKRVNMFNKKLVL